jgi:hypothetical protein
VPPQALPIKYCKPALPLLALNLIEELTPCPRSKNPAIQIRMLKPETVGNLSNAEPAVPDLARMTGYST